MFLYTKILSFFYTLGAALHLLDIFDLRLEFSTMPFGWKAWIVFLLVADTIAAIGLWKQKGWGYQTFIAIAVTQIIAYTLFKSYFGPQPELIIFHTITLAIYFALLRRQQKVRQTI